MSIGAPSTSQLFGYTGTAPDSDLTVVCFGAKRMTMQISNNPVLITFGLGPGGAVVFDVNPEFYLPVVGSITRPFDAFKIRAATPTAQLQAGQLQAYVVLQPRAS